MSTPIRKEFGPGYDYPNRKFHLWAVILPTVLIIALAVILVRRTSTPSNPAVRSPVVACPKQACPPPGSTTSAKATQTAKARQTAKAASTQTSGLGALGTSVRQLSPPVPGATRAVLSRASSAVTQAVILSSA